jgi:lipoate-protein ligase A
LEYRPFAQIQHPKSQQFPIGKIEVRIDVVEGYIQGVRFYGNFTGQRDVAELEYELVGVRYDPQALRAALREIDIATYFGDLAETAFLNLLY